MTLDIRRPWLVLAIGLVLLGCGKRATVDRTYDQGESPLGDPEESYGTNISFSDDEDAELDRAKALVRDRRFADATRVLTHLTQTAGGDVRAEALLRLGEVQGSLMNPDKDYAAAVATLETLVNDYPRSEHRARAADAIERYRALLEGTSAP